MSSGGTGRGSDGAPARGKGCLSLAIAGRKQQIKQREEENKLKMAGKSETWMQLQRNLMRRGGNIHVTTKALEFIPQVNDKSLFVFILFFMHGLSSWKLCGVQEHGPYTGRVWTWRTAWRSHSWRGMIITSVVLIAAVSNLCWKYQIHHLRRSTLHTAEKKTRTRLRDGTGSLVSRRTGRQLPTLTSLRQHFPIYQTPINAAASPPQHHFQQLVWCSVAIKVPRKYKKDF